MNALLALWRSEPALVVGFVTAALDLSIAFGLPVTPDQKLTVVGLVTALMALLGAAVTRSQVYSPASVRAMALGDPDAPEPPTFD